MNNTTLLTSIDSPLKLRQLADDQLPQLAQEIRDYIIATLNQCGGHFAANMGAVELAIAVHYIFNTPKDRVIWDVGHQGYPHKILTGRYHQLATVRSVHGLAPFPKRSESEYDCFGVGHSSTSISAGLGMAIAAQLDDRKQKTIAVIGDGGLTGGMAFEALNHGGSLTTDLLVILNDNEMSISPNVGALTNYFVRIISGQTYSTLREKSKKLLQKAPFFKKLLKRTKTQLKGMFIPGVLFEELGFHYVGPIDGHNISQLLKCLRTMQQLHGPQLLHVITKKGKGYLPAEIDPVKYHAVKPGFAEDCINHRAKAPNTATIHPVPAKAAKLTYSQIFGQWLCDMAEQDSRLIAITPAMCEGSGMIDYAKRFPERYIDVSIAEQHSVTLAAGLACEGKKPVLAIYSTFLQRGYDQLIHDVACQNLDVTFALDRAGLVEDGQTHSGIFDLSYLRCIPHLLVLAPADENECRQMLYTAYQHQGPSAVRYPRGSGPGVAINKEMSLLPLGKAQLRRQGRQVALLSFGSMLKTALEVGAAIDATVVNMRFIKPLDKILIQQLAQTHPLLVTVEENVISGGAGSAVNELLAAENIVSPILNLGLPDQFIDHGPPDFHLQSCGLDAPGIIKKIRERQKLLCSFTKESVNESLPVVTKLISV